MENEKLEMFFKELSELTNKYGFAICGCGCCGSPWVEDVENKKDIAEDLSYNKDKKKYDYHDLLK